MAENRRHTVGLGGLLTVVLLVCPVRASGSMARAGGRDVEGVVNLNTAPMEVLTLLPGIGPAKARAIMVYRLRRSFHTVDELVRVKGIGRRMVREMRPHLAIAGPSTARQIAAAGAGLLLVSPAPPLAPPPARPVCRPGGQTAPKPLPVRPHVTARASLLPATSRANHCAPPA